MRYKPSDNVTFDFVDSWDKNRIEPTPNEPFLMQTFWEGNMTSPTEARNHTFSGLITAEVKPGYDVEQAYALCGYLVNHYNTTGDDWTADFNIFRFISITPSLASVSCFFDLSSSSMASISALHSSISELTSSI